jgi:16S rRNA (guanine527-N7)-methyltransferase
MGKMKIDEFIDNIKILNIDVTDDKLKQLEIYKDFLIEYNTHTNLTAIKEENDIYLKHFYDSLTLTKACDLNNINSLLDIGTGAGFPGMVLKIFFPNLEVTLLDSNNKKTTFLKELANKLNINVNVINMRVEDYAKDNLNKFDIVTSRAVANLRVLAELSLPLVKENGLFIPMKGFLDSSLEDSIDTIEIMNGIIENKLTFDLYNGSGIRNILVIKKVKNTSKDSLRRYDRIVKKPLQKKDK